MHSTAMRRIQPSKYIEMFMRILISSRSMGEVWVEFVEGVVYLRAGTVQLGFSMSYYLIFRILSNFTNYAMAINNLDVQKLVINRISSIAKQDILRIPGW